jgi:trimeric autotransporter adhesin
LKTRLLLCFIVIALAFGSINANAYSNPRGRIVYALPLKTGTHAAALNNKIITDTIAVVPYLRLQLYKDAINNDDTYIGFGSGFSTKYVVNEDARYMQGQGEESLCSISGDNVPLAINKLPFPGKQSLVIGLKVRVTADGAYSLNMTQEVDIPQIYEVWLMDAYKKDSLDMKLTKTYAFNIVKADTNTYGSKRFSLVVRQTPAPPALTAHLLTFTAQKANNGAQIDWTTSDEQNTTNFTVERSIDSGATFTPIDTLISSSVGSYFFLDKTPPPHKDVYRVKLQDASGTATYSEAITLDYESTISTNYTVPAITTHISVYPNPASGVINMEIKQTGDNNSSAGVSRQNINSIASLASTASNTMLYDVKIINITGMVIRATTSSQPTWQEDISGLMPGTYIIQVTKNSNKSVVGKSRFVKL